MNCSRLQESDFERREEHWAEAKRALEDRIHSLEAELKEREEESLNKHKGNTGGPLYSRTSKPRINEGEVLFLT